MILTAENSIRLVQKMQIMIVLCLIILFSGTISGKTTSSFNKFQIARVKYGGGGDWYSNPSSIPNLQKFLYQETGVVTESEEAVVELSNPRLFTFPYIYINGHGNIKFTDREVNQLRKYLESGGFMHADDNYGMDKSFRREMKKVLPDAKFIEIPFNHSIYHSHFNFNSGSPKIHEHDGKPSQGLGLFLNGKLVVFYTYQSDLGDGWEDPDVHNDPAIKRMAALRMGTNIIMWRLRGGN